MAGERPQFINHDLLQIEQAAAPADPEPLEGQPLTYQEGGDPSPLGPLFYEFANKGVTAYKSAVEMERQGRQLAADEEREYELDDGTVAAYREASVNLLGARRESLTLIDDYVDPVHLLMIGASLAKQADAPIVEAEGDPWAAHFDAPRDRRAYLRQVSAVTLHRASELIYGVDENDGFSKEFDEAQERADKLAAEQLRLADAQKEALASSAVEAAKDIGAKYSYGPGAVDEGAVERLTEDHPALTGFVEKHARGKDGPQFIAKMAHLAISKLATQEYSLPLAA